MRPKLFGCGEIDLVGGDGEFAADGAPDLDVDLRAVEGGFVRHFDVVDAAALEDAADHVLGLEPERGVIDEFLAELRRIVGGETHDVFLDAEDLEILQIHLVHGEELGFELLFGAVDVGVVHLERAHAHEAEEFAALLVAIAGAVFGEAQRQVAITARHRSEELVVMRAVHRFEVVAIVRAVPRCFSARDLSRSTSSSLRSSLPRWLSTL